MRIRLLTLLLLLSSSAFADLSPSPIARLRATHAQWRVEDRAAGVSVSLPALSRVIVLEEKKDEFTPVKIGFYRDGEIRFGWIEPGALGSRIANSASPEIERSSFLADARIELLLAKKMIPIHSERTDFSQLVARLTEQLDCIENQDSRFSAAAWEKQKKSWRDLFKGANSDRVSTLTRYKGLIFETLNPSYQDRRLSESTLVVPLSMPWFRSTPELSEYFEQEWVGARFDLRIRGGDSGEGVGRLGDDGTGEFFKMFERFENLRAWIERAGDERLIRSPEYLWLASLDDSVLRKTDRLIFIHEFTWESQPDGRPWQDSIAVDQSFGPINNSALMSVLIHEINVNSVNPSFLPTDTHLPYEDSETLWKLAGALKNPRALNLDAAVQTTFLGRSPFLGVATLGILLPSWAGELGCRLK